MQTEGLLKQSQQLAGELQTQQKELQQTNEQLEQKAQQLAERNVEVERKNQEIEQARRALEEKATELSLTSKYKSEFLANMSPRAAHAAQQHPDPRPAAYRKSGRQPDRQAGRIRPHHPRRRHRPVEPDQRHPRSVEDRIRNGDGGCGRNPHRQSAGHRRPAVPARGGQPAAVVQHRRRSQPRTQHRHRFRSACSRC